VWHDSFMCGTGWRRLIGSRKLQIIFHKRATKYRSLLRKMTYEDKGSYESSPPGRQRRDGFACVTWLMCLQRDMCDVTCVTWRVSRDSRTYITWLIEMCDVTHSDVGYGLFRCLTWLVHTCDVTRSHVWRDSFICGTWLFHTCVAWLISRVMWLVHMTQSCVSCLTHRSDMPHLFRVNKLNKKIAWCDSSTWLNVMSHSQEWYV